MALHSPLYRQRLAGVGRWSAAGLRPLHDLSELAELPFTTADDLRPGEALLCVSRDEVARMVTVSTSGSTGVPKRLAFSDAELARTRDFFAVGMAQMVTAGQHVAVLLPGAHRPRGITDLLAGSLASQGVSVTACMDLADLLLCVPEQAPEGAAARLAAVRAAWQALAATAPAGLGLVLLPRQMACLWWAFPQTPPGLCAALCAADWLDPGLRRQVEQGWDCLVLDHYGSTESAFAGAVQCRCREGAACAGPGPAAGDSPSCDGQGPAGGRDRGAGHHHLAAAGHALVALPYGRHGQACWTGPVPAAVRCRVWGRCWGASSMPDRDFE